MPQGSPETNFLLLGFPGFFIRDGDTTREILFLVWKLSLQYLLSMALNYQRQKIGNFLISSPPRKLLLPSIYLMCFNPRKGGGRATHSSCQYWLDCNSAPAALLQGWQMLWGVLDASSLFISGLRFPFLMLSSYHLKVRLGKGQVYKDNSLEMRYCTESQGRKKD